jgi:hypothetical protein
LKTTTGAHALSVIAAISGLYDIVVGACLLFLRPQLAAWMSAPLPVPPIHAELNALFLIAVGIGYWLPYREPDRYRGYLWVMGPVLKGAGAVTFVLDYLVRESPAGYLLFAASDGTLALITLVILVSNPAAASATGNTSVSRSR